MMSGVAPLKPLVSVRYLSFVLGVPRHRLREVAAVADCYYDPFVLCQERGGRVRRRPIDNPLDPLKFIQRRIKARLLDAIELPGFVTGGVPKRSTQMNAALHVGRREVVTVDFRNFFPSISNQHVAQMWRRQYGASTEVAWLLTRLTTYKGHVPQGSPASNGVANLVVLPLLKDLEAQCSARGTTLSAYVDDITVSGQVARTTLNDIAVAASRFGLTIARKKTTVMPAHTRQRVTGHVVNRKLSNGRSRVQDAWHRLQGALGGSGPINVQSLRGLVTHIRATCPTQARALVELFDEVQRKDAGMKGSTVRLASGAVRTSPSGQRLRESMTNTGADLGRLEVTSAAPSKADQRCRRPLALANERGRLCSNGES